MGKVNTERKERAIQNSEELMDEKGGIVIKKGKQGKRERRIDMKIES